VWACSLQPLFKVLSSLFLIFYAHYYCRLNLLLTAPKSLVKLIWYEDLLELSFKDSSNQQGPQRLIVPIEQANIYAFHQLFLLFEIKGGYYFTFSDQLKKSDYYSLRRKISLSKMTTAIEQQNSL
jgi:hypothetical protein